MTRERHPIDYGQTLASVDTLTPPLRQAKGPLWTIGEVPAPKEDAARRAQYFSIRSSIQRSEWVKEATDIIRSKESHRHLCRARCAPGKLRQHGSDERIRRSTSRGVVVHHDAGRFGDFM